MKDMRLIISLFVLLLIGCEAGSDSDANDQSKLDQLKELVSNKNPKCPLGHTDSILDIIYGLPTAETFAKADSGLVAIGGCELADEEHYCTIHDISF